MSNELQTNRGFFHNPEYDEPLLIETISDESSTFTSVLSSLVKDTEPTYPTNRMWLGTLSLNGKPTQVVLTVSQESNNFVDEG